MARIKAVRESALRRAEQAPRPVLRIAKTFLREMTNIEPFDRAMTLAAQAFTSIFPLLITVAAIRNDGDGNISDDIATSLSLPDSMATALDQVLPSDTGQVAAFGIISVLIVLISATSFSRALGRMYAKAWHVPPSGWLGGWRWVAVIVTICAMTILTHLINYSADELTQYVAALSVTFLLNILLWTVVPWLLLVGRVSLVRLLPAAALMGVGSVGLTVASRIYMPYALRAGSEHFGALGIAFTLIGWLFVVSFVLVIATVLGAVIVQGEGIESLAPRLRSQLRPASEQTPEQGPPG
jgi:membrane protein